MPIFLPARDLDGIWSQCRFLSVRCVSALGKKNDPFRKSRVAIVEYFRHKTAADKLSVGVLVKVIFARQISLTPRLKLQESSLEELVQRATSVHQENVVVSRFSECCWTIIADFLGLSDEVGWDFLEFCWSDNDPAFSFENRV